MTRSDRSDAARRALEERRDSVLRDLEELALQAEEGEIPEEDAAVLEARYRKDLAEVEARLGAMPRSPSGGERPAAAGGKPAEREPTVLVGSCTSWPFLLISVASGQDHGPSDALPGLAIEHGA